MRCPRCGEEIPDDSAFCPYCSAKVEQAAASNALTLGEEAPGAGPGQGPGAGAVQESLPPPLPPKKTGLKKLLIIAGTALLIAVLIVVLLVVFFFQAVKAPIDVTNRYVKAVNEGDARSAWDVLHEGSGFKKYYTFDSFKEQPVGLSRVQSRKWNAYKATVSGSKAAVLVRLTFRDGKEMEIQFDLRKTGDGWMIYEYGQPSGE